MRKNSAFASVFLRKLFDGGRTVWCFTNCGEAELFAGDISYGSPEYLAADTDYVYTEKDGTLTVVVNVRIMDHKNCLVEDADNMVTFSYPENVILLGTGNGDPSSHENAKQNYRRAFNGRLQAIFSVRGKAAVKISSQKLTETMIEF